MGLGRKFLLSVLGSVSGGVFLSVSVSFLGVLFMSSVSVSFPLQRVPGLFQFRSKMTQLLSGQVKTVL
jgi:hypothetical protein